MALNIRVPQFSDTPDNFAAFYSDYLQSVPEEVRRLGCNRIFLLVSSSLNNATDRIQKLEMILGNRVVAKKVGVKAHTPYTDVLDLVDQLHESQADIIVSIGSSSYTDAAKIAMVSRFTRDACTHRSATFQIVRSSLKPSDLSISAMDALATTTDDSGTIIVPNNLKVPALKLIVVPTTLSAAEYNVSSGATHPETRKKATFTHSLCAAKCVILDPELCTTTPQRLWLSTGMRAVDHCVEAMCTDLATSVVEESAEEGLRHLVPGLLACSVDNMDVSARGACQVGAWRAMEAVHQKVPLGASHAIGHQLGSVASVPHGETSCAMLPSVMKYNKRVNSTRQEKVAETLWGVAGETFQKYGLHRKTADAGDLIKALVKSLGLPTTLGEVGVKESQWDRIAEHTLTDVWGKTNPRRLESKEQVKEVLRMAS